MRLGFRAWNDIVYAFLSYDTFYPIRQKQKYATQSASVFTYSRHLTAQGYRNCKFHATDTIIHSTVTVPKILISQTYYECFLHNSNPINSIKIL